MELYATELFGVKAYDVQGNYVGRVREFFIEPAVARPFSAAGGQAQPNCLGFRQEDSAKRRREVAGNLPAQRVLAGGAERPAGPANHRHAWAKSGARERPGPGRAALQWECGIAVDASGRGVAGGGATAAARLGSLQGGSQTAATVAAEL